MLSYESYIMSLEGMFSSRAGQCREKLNSGGKAIEGMLEGILRSINLNSRYLTKSQIKYLCDINTVEQCIFRLRHCHASNINTINRLWSEIEDRLNLA